MLGITVQGLLLFSFIPLVLFLFLRQPLGPGWSVAAGLAIMAGHRLVAAPWMAKFADVRCLWCGRVGASVSFPVVAGRRTWTMAACSDDHLDRVTRFLNFLHTTRPYVAAGIFAPLSLLLLASASAALGRPAARVETAALVFRIVVAFTVVTAATVPFVARMPSHGQPLRCGFPLHNLFLLGIRNTLWIFRIVGAWWLIDGVTRLLQPGR
jgi:hypothetical protein